MSKKSLHRRLVKKNKSARSKRTSMSKVVKKFTFLPNLPECNK